MGISVSELVRVKLEQQNANSFVESELLTRLGKAGGNLNQIAKTLNSNPKAISVYNDLYPLFSEIFSTLEEIRIAALKK